MCHGLEYLRLDENILAAFTAQIGSLLSTSSVRYTMPGPIVLPLLRTLQLMEHPDAIFHTLTTIHAPQASGVGVWSGLMSPLIFTRVLGPNPSLRYPFLSSPHAITLSCWHEIQLRLSLRCRPGEEKVCSIVDSGSEEGSHMDLELNLVAVMDAFSVAAIDTLKLEGHLESAETWQRLFAMFSGLRVLNVEGAGNLDALWAGLVRATKTSMAERARDGLEAAAVCCPLLSEIAIGGNRYAYYSEFSASSTLFERVREALCVHADAGAPRLKRLQLHLPYTRHGWLQIPENMVLREAFLEDVKTLVEDLDYSDLRFERRLGTVPSIFRWRPRSAGPRWMVSHG